MDRIELWGGHECTVNRVGAAFADQTRLSGHHDRLDDLDRFAALGITALRYPVLWERVAPDSAEALDFTWTDARLQRIATLGLRPIIGLLHHGSGPTYTHLLDDGFAEGLANFAGHVARRYPGVRDWTPINEPLTTARFSCLYGLWYPHVSDETMFWRALLNQVDATRLAMAAIRAVTPDARLIQTEDFGRTYATRPLAHQAEFDNDRRWMTWDLLFGRVAPGHRLWTRLCSYGLEQRLRAILAAPCPPDVLGVNHYLTSDRFLDHRCDRYPAERCGGNSFVRYADVEAVRVLSPAPSGLAGVLDEIGRRYDAAIAITEAHNGCTREEQMRWIVEAWRAAQDFQARGGRIEAVTAWSLLGSYDWNSLLTERRGHYECGVFDLRSPAPRPTATVPVLQSLSRGEVPDHPAAAGPGWWRRDVRLEHRPVIRSLDGPEPRTSWRTLAGPTRPVLITGASGTLGRALARACEWRGLDYVLTARSDLDLSERESIDAALERFDPWAVINAAGYVRVDDAEHDRDTCFEANAWGPERLARACAARGVKMAGFSSDLVFGGEIGRPHVEGDRPGPLNVYGASKADAERLVLSACPTALMVRTAAFFSAHDNHNFAVQVLQALAEQRQAPAADDLLISPTYVPDLVDAVLDLVIDGEAGVWHLSNSSPVTWAEFARRIAKALDMDADLIWPRSATDFGWPARRPVNAALGSERGAILPSLDDAIVRFAAALRARDDLSSDAVAPRPSDASRGEATDISRARASSR